MNIKTTAKPTPVAASKHLLGLLVKFFQARGVGMVLWRKLPACVRGVKLMASWMAKTNGKTNGKQDAYPTYTILIKTG
jgi:hypothetical protein